MNLKKRDELLEIFSEAFHQTVPQLLEDMKKELATKEDIYRIERKLDSHEARMDRQGKTLENHEERLKILETS